VAGDIIRTKALDLVVSRVTLVPTDPPKDASAVLPQQLESGETDHGSDA
jgi:hypothetical protein